MGRATSSGAREHFARHREQPRADLEGAALGLRQRDVEAHLVIDEDEIDHAAVRQGILGFRHGENRLPFCNRENLRQPGALRLADEKHLDPGDGLAAAHATHDDCALQDSAPFHYLLEFRGELVGADHSYGEGAFGPGECLWRPFHEAAELVEKGGLDLRLGGRTIDLRERRNRRHSGKRDDQRAEAKAQSDHLSLRNTPRSISLRVAAAPNSGWLRSKRFCAISASSRPRSNCQASRASSAVYPGTAGLGSGPTHLTITSNSCRPGSTSDARRFPSCR